MRARRNAVRERAAGGFVLIMVLVVILLASMVVTSLMFVLTAEQMAAAAGTDGEQARAVALSGVYQALRVAANAGPGSIDWQDNAAVFRDQLVSDDGAQKWYFSVYSVTDSGGIRYGMTDEASKLNVYRATEAMLESLPNMAPSMAQGLLALLGNAGSGAGSNAAPAGAPAPADTAPPPGPQPGPNGPGTNAPASNDSQPLSCLDELLQVSGFTVPLLYGSFTNLTGRFDKQTEAFATPASVQAQEEDADTGLQQFLTVCSYDLNQDNDGSPRVNLNQDDLSTLNLPKATVDYIMSRRQSQQPLQHPAELIDVLSNTNGAAGQDADSVKAELAVVLDRCTATNQAKLAGLVNVNTASTKVLAAVPGLSPSLAEAIVAARVGLSPDARKTTAWLYEDGVLNADAFKQAAPYLTTRSFQFRFLAAGYALPAGSYCVLEAVVDAAAKPPAVLFLRDATLLGLPFTPTPSQDDTSSSSQVAAGQ